MKLSEIDLTGYVPYVPKWISYEVMFIDEEACHSITCRSCGTKRLNYVPYHHPQHKQYKVLAVCPICSEVQEI